MPDEPLLDAFSSATLPSRLAWFCPPAHWQLDPARASLHLQPDAGTDFWQRTHYGFEADNGHFLWLAASGDFVLSTMVRFHPKHQYDQAGLMLRLSPACWIKTSVEFEPDGPNRLGAVVTNHHYSDWSTQPVQKAINTLWLRLRAEGHDVIVDSSHDGKHWEQLRLAHLHERAAAASVACGLYACSPKAAGFEATFSHFTFQPGRVS